MDDIEYPTEEQLDALARFIGTPHAFFDRVRDLWAYPELVAEMPGTDEAGRPVVAIRLVTAGWSGNEAVANVVERSFAHVLWWVSSVRGGLSTYEVPGAMFDSEINLGVLAGTNPDEIIDDLRNWKTNAEATLAENRKVMDRDTDRLSRLERSVTGWEAIAARAHLVPASAQAATPGDAIREVTFDLRGIFNSHLPPESRTAAHL